MIVRQWSQNVKSINHRSFKIQSKRSLCLSASLFFSIMKYICMHVKNVWASTMHAWNPFEEIAKDSRITELLCYTLDSRCRCFCGKKKGKGKTIRVLLVFVQHTFLPLVHPLDAYSRESVAWKHRWCVRKTEDFYVLYAYSDANTIMSILHSTLWESFLYLRDTYFFKIGSQFNTQCCFTLRTCDFTM